MIRPGGLVKVTVSAEYLATGRTETIVFPQVVGYSADIQQERRPEWGLPGHPDGGLVYVGRPIEVTGLSMAFRAIQDPDGVTYHVQIDDPSKETQD